MSDKLVSVIIPLYNAEAHLARTLESVIQQDYSELEIIVVNDSSTDSTRTIAHSLLQESSRTFRIIDHSHKLGVSAARNSGLAHSNGSYVWFCDGDDIAQSNLVSELLGLAEKYDSDIAFGGILERFDDKPDKVCGVSLNEPLPLDGEKALYLRMLKPIAPHLCCILFRKEFLDANKIRFTEGCTASEDIEFEMKAFCHAKRIAFSSECLYVYVHSPAMGSVRDNDTKAKRLSRYADSSQAQRRTAEYLAQNAPSERTRSLAEKLLLPQSLIRSFTVYAKFGDKKAFRSLLKDHDTRKTLLSSFRVLFRKPELFAKAIAILFAPSLYFWIRRDKH